MTWKYYINEIDDFIIVGGILLPVVIWGAYVACKRRFSIASIFWLSIALAIALATLGPALLREVIR